MSGEGAITMYEDDDRSMSAALNAGLHIFNMLVGYMAFVWDPVNTLLFSGKRLVFCI